MDTDFERYKRQLLIEYIGEDGQKKISSSKIGVVGAGGLGSIVIPQLIALGFGTIRIFEGDSLTITNLTRQIIYREEDIGKKKAEVLKNRLGGLNSEVKLEVIDEFIENNKQIKYFEDLDIIVDATDNIKSRLLLDSFCQRLNIPFIHGAIMGTIGQAGVFIPPKSIKSLYRTSKETHGEVPVIVPICGVIGSIQVNEVVRIAITGKSPLNGKLLLVDLKSLSFKEVQVS